MRRRVAWGVILVLTMAATAGFGQDERPEGPIGFSPGSRAAEAEAEAHALAVPTPNQARSWLRTLTEEPHVAGTPADRKTALFVRDRLREWGWQAEIAEYEVLLNYPLPGVALEVLRPYPQKLKVMEDPYVLDKDSASPDAFPAFHGYGASGDVLGQVVYANYGRPEDFKALDGLGIDVRDKIVLVRYGGPFRGLKVRNAQLRGARGVLIYSDPADDGYARGDVYPLGPYRPPSALQRGSVQFLSLGPGDPSTPFGPSIKGAKRLPIHPMHGFPISQPNQAAFNGNVNEKAVADWEKQSGLKRNEYFPAIPSLPISYESARPILETLGGANVPGGWQGGLPFAYHVGPGPCEVRFAITMDYQLRPIWNVIATLKGSVEPDRWVLIGNHRDAWVYGAVDPSSGSAATLETCRALGAAVKRGWKPRRSLVYASWDAEEYGLVGSTEWAEHHADELKDKAVLMLNVDAAVAGPDMDLEGVASLRDLVLDAAGSITEPRTGKTLRTLWLDRQRSAWADSGPLDLGPPANGNGSSSSPQPRPGPPFAPQMSPLGSGSDYTAFVDHLGVPAVDLDFRGHYGVYHSVYDDFFWMEKFGDPEFVSHATAARLYALIAMRAAGADVVPLRFTPYADAIGQYLDDLRRTVERKGRASEPDLSKPPSLRFEGLPDLMKAVDAFHSQAVALDAATRALVRRDGVDAARLSRVNDALTRVERAFLLSNGLPGRPWFKHAIYAPGLTTGYASWPLPGVRQAILEGNASMLSEQTKALIERLRAATDAMKVAAEAAGAQGTASGGH